MRSTISLAENDDLEASRTILQIGHVLGRKGLGDCFVVKGPKYRCDDKHPTTTRERPFRVV